MKSIFQFPMIVSAIVLSGAALLAQGYVNQPMPTVQNPIQGHGGSGLGRGRALNDHELTAIVRASESVEVQLAAAHAARAAMVEIAFNSPSNAAGIRAAAQRLGEAEQALAIARADAYARLRMDSRFTAPEKAQAVASALTRGD
jgi:hypothetical protein